MLAGGEGVVGPFPIHRSLGRVLPRCTIINAHQLSERSLLESLAGRKGQGGRPDQPARFLLEPFLPVGKAFKVSRE